MNSYDVKRLALVLALQAEIEGMKADGRYIEQNFLDKAEELRELAYKHDEQL